MRSLLCILSSLLLALPAAAQNRPAAHVADAITWRSIGPSNMGGRVTDLAVVPGRPQVFYVGLATGGVLKTTNHGTTFASVFDGAGMGSVGAVAVAPSAPRHVWVGTGEANARNSVSWGDGVWHSADAGKTWRRAGLRDSRAIGRIVVHPRDPKVVYVAAVGSTWGDSEQGGLYRTTDGGRTWRKVLDTDVRTGAIDVLLDPHDPRTVFAATYERRRDRYDLNDPVVRWGAGAALWRSRDGGERWTRLSGPSERRGLPTVPLGRIGLTACAGKPGVLFAVVESELIGKALPGSTTAPLKGPAYMGVNGADGAGGARLTRVMPRSAASQAGLKAGDVITRIDGKPVAGYRALVAIIRARKAGQTVEVAWRRQGKPMTARLTFGARGRSADPKRRFAGPLGGQVGGAEAHQGPRGFEQGGIYRSDDGGERWRRVSSLNPRPFYFSKIRVDPGHPSRLWCLGIRLHRSLDGGKTWNNQAGRGTHVDYHAMWIDPRDPDHVILGSDGGLYTTWDGGKTWDHLNTFAAGQYYRIGLDNRTPYYVYGGLQDNGTWGGPSRVRAGSAIQSDWRMLMGGDGFGVVIDPQDNGRLVMTAQYGRLRRIDLRRGSGAALVPRRGTKVRFNWNTPFLLSPHDRKRLWVGGTMLLRVDGDGREMIPVSKPLTLTPKGTLTALAEDHHAAGLLYAGSDDGALQVSTDGGKTWSERSAALVPPLPGRRYVAGIEASRHVKGRVYVAFDGHRSDDLAPYVYVSEDAGQSFRRIVRGLPSDVSVRVVREDPRNAALLYVGTETGVRVSLDAGETWRPLGAGLPTVPVFDLRVHRRDRELVAGTHGRSIWIADVAPLQDAAGAEAGDVAWLGAKRSVLYDRAVRGRLSGARHFRAANPPAFSALLYLPVTPIGGVKLTLEVVDASGRQVRALRARSLREGYNRVEWDLRRAARRVRGRRRGPVFVEPGRYALRARVGPRVLASAGFEVVADPGDEPGLVRRPASAGSYESWLDLKQREGGWKGH